MVVHTIASNVLPGGLLAFMLVHLEQPIVKHCHFLIHGPKVQLDKAYLCIMLRFLQWLRDAGL